MKYERPQPANSNERNVVEIPTAKQPQSEEERIAQEQAELERAARALEADPDLGIRDQLPSPPIARFTLPTPTRPEED